MSRSYYSDLWAEEETRNYNEIPFMVSQKGQLICIPVTQDMPTIGIAGAILTEAGLSFLGFGVPPPHATWGNILSDGKRFLFDAPWLTYIPGLSILIIVLAFNLFGEGLRDALNPKLRKR